MLKVYCFFCAKTQLLTVLREWYEEPVIKPRSITWKANTSPTVFMLPGMCFCLFFCPSLCLFIFHVAKIYVLYAFLSWLTSHRITLSSCFSYTKRKEFIIYLLNLKIGNLVPDLICLENIPLSVFRDHSWAQTVSTACMAKF